MREFFRGWRRKVGTVTLGMALGFSGLWVRSLSVRDIAAWKHIHAEFRIRSFEGTLGWQRLAPPSSNTWTGWQSQTNFKGDFFDPWSTFEGFDVILWRWDWLGFSLGSALLDEPEVPRINPEIVVFIVPYWSIVIPLALLAAYLLLSKPRAKKHQVASEV
jgi:hypothetical protein